MKVSIPAWTEFPLAVVALFAGTSLIATLGEHYDSAAELNTVLAQAPLGMLFLAAVIIPPIEAFIWSAAFVEAAVAFLRLAWVGVVLGALGYGVAFHWSADIWSKLVALWLGFLSGAMYLHARRRGRFLGFAYATGLRWCFVWFGVALARGWL